MLDVVFCDDGVKQACRAAASAVHNSRYDPTERQFGDGYRRSEG